MSLRITALVGVALLATACGGSKSQQVRPANPYTVSGELADRRAERLSAEQLYRTARVTLESGDYSTALQVYQRLENNYPFTRYATQGKLESIFAHYRAFEPELALAAADRFLRSHPRHPRIDYVHFLKGMINFERSAADVLDIFDIDSAKRDPSNAKRAFEEFARLIQRFPDSPYAGEARRRMLYLKDRIAKHEKAIADYYFRRHAYVAASRRAQDILARFQGTPTIPPTLDLLARCYDRLELPQQAELVRAALAASYPEYVSR